MEEYMSENNSGAPVQQPDNRSNEQGKDNKRQRFDPSKQQDGGRNRNRNANPNHRRRNNGPRPGGNDNKKRDNQDAQQPENKNRERNSDRPNNRDKRNNFKREQNQGGEKKQQQQFSSERKPKPKRSREFGDEVAKNVKKVETIDDIRSDNARITKEIYLEIASLKNINLN